VRTIGRLGGLGWAGLAALLVAGCGAERPDPARPLVLVSIVPQTWFVERLAGERVEVLAMVPAGASVELHEPGLRELDAVSRASVYLALGHPRFAFERTWLERVAAARPDLAVVETAPGEDPGSDPHVWLAPSRARAQARRSAEALTGLLPGAQGDIDANLAALEAELDALEAELAARFEPLRGARFWVFHPAWSRFAEELGIEQVAIERDGKEPDPRALAELVRRARADGVRLVFAQPQMSAASARVVADEIGARVEFLDPLAPDWDANLRRSAERIAAGAVR
jgi:zinc transport system substrate-binding protein